MKNEPLCALLIEDDPGEACLIRELLRRSTDAAYELRHAGTLADGLAFLHVSPADIVLLDLTLPDSSGLDTLVRFMTAAPGVPVIVQTAVNDDEVGRAALRQGAQYFLVKGRFDGRMLYAAIKYAMERHGLFQKVAGINQSILELERNRVVQEMVDSTAHAISQPLTVLTMVTSQLMMEADPHDRNYERIARLCEATDRLNRVVRDLAGKRKHAPHLYPGEVQVLDLSNVRGADAPNSLPPVVTAQQGS